MRRLLVLVASGRVLSFGFQFLGYQLRQVSLHSLEDFSFLSRCRSLSLAYLATGTTPERLVLAMLFQAIIVVVAFKLIVSIVLFLGLIVRWLMIGPTASTSTTEVVLGQH